MHAGNAAIGTDGLRLGLAGPLSIEMPPLPEVTADDIDAQLFTYVANAPKGSGITTIHDLDDDWASKAFPGIPTMQGLREAIEKQLRQENAYGYQDLKYARCADALVACLEGEIPQEAIDANIGEVRRRVEAAIRSNGESLPQYLVRSGLSEEEFEERVLEETVHDVALNIALDLLIEGSGEEVGEEELPLYLDIDDVGSFLEEARAAGRLDDAKQAAARVKAMRGLMGTARIV